MSSLSVRNAYFSYNSKPILENIHLDVDKGEILTILGPNGSGKTTLIKCIVGLLSLDKGSIKVNGISMNNLSIRDKAKKIAYLPQENNLHFHFSVFDVVLMGRTPYVGMLKKPLTHDIEIALRSIDTLEVRDLAKRIYASLSGGEKKLVMIARALAQDTNILIFDEPTNHLDFKNQFVILDKIKHIARQNNMCVVISLHDPNLARIFSDKVLMIKNGKTEAYGMAKDVINEHNLNDVYDIKIDVYRSNEAFMALPHLNGDSYGK